jgi:hypothetical protein
LAQMLEQDPTACVVFLFETPCTKPVQPTRKRAVDEVLVRSILNLSSFITIASKTRGRVIPGRRVVIRADGQTLHF